MKRIVSVILAALLSVSALLSLTACDGSNQETSSGSSNTGEKIIRTYRWYDDVPEDEIARDEAFYEATGIKIEYTSVAWANMSLQLMLDFASVDVPDMIYMPPEAHPNYANKGLLEPLEDIVPSDNHIWDDMTAMDSYAWGGKHYGICSADPLFIYFNKTMFTENDVKSPLEYWQEGNWNWETLRKAGMELADDSDHDGVVDRWGFANLFFEAMAVANGGVFLEYPTTGGVEIAYESPQMIEMFTYLQNATMTDKWMNPGGNFTWWTDFIAEKVAMVVGAIGHSYAQFGSVDFEWDIVPMPLGPSNTENIYPASVSGMGIPKGAKNAQNVVAYFDFLYEYNQDEERIANSNARKALTDEQWERYEWIKDQKQGTSIYTGIGNLQSLQFGIWEPLMGTAQSVNSILAAQKPVWQHEIDTALEDTEIITREDFTPPDTIDFESGESNLITIQDGSNELVGVTGSEIVTGDEAIDGSSLKIIADPEAMGSVIFRTVPSEIKLPIYYDYHIELEYKLVGEPIPGGYLVMAMRTVDDVMSGQGFSPVSFDLAADHEVHTITADFSVTSELNNDIVLCLVGGGVPDIVIDNIRITVD